MILERINRTGDIKNIEEEHYGELASEIREFLISSISGTGGPENALEVVVAIDGQEAAVFPLSGSEDVIIDGYQGGFNHLVIKDGEAVLTEADCPDRRCTRMGPISEPGEWMVCLPHRVTVTIR